MSYSNVWAEVVFCGFPKKEIFTTSIVCASSKSIYHLTKFQMLIYSG